MSWFVAVVNRFSIFSAIMKLLETRLIINTVHGGGLSPLDCMLGSDMYDYAPSLYTHSSLHLFQKITPKLGVI